MAEIMDKIKSAFKSITSSEEIEKEKEIVEEYLKVFEINDIYDRRNNCNCTCLYSYSNILLIIL